MLSLSTGPGSLQKKKSVSKEVSDTEFLDNETIEYTPVSTKQLKTSF